MGKASAISRRPDQGRRAFWLKHLHQWHWISSALCLVGMILFAITGITLNHAADIEARPTVTEQRRDAPPDLVAALAAWPGTDRARVPPLLGDWLRDAFGIGVGGRAAEWSANEIYVGLPRPGGDAWVSLDLATGEALFEVTDRGWVSFLNDLHKGRNAGLAWAWFLDIFAGACLVFCLTGLFLLQLHGGNRPATWPVAGFGLVAPLLLVILFIH